MSLRALFLTLIILTSVSVFAQTDSVQNTEPPIVVKVKKEHSAKGASIRSAIIPGWGQLYNKKYWKIPIIFGAAAGASYYIGFNIGRTNAYKDAYLIKTNSDPLDDGQIEEILSFDEFAPLYSETDLLELKGIYRNYLDISVIAFTLIYVLNIVDASVDGHLYDFDMSDDLSLSIKPELMFVRGKHFPGLGLTLKL